VILVLLGLGFAGWASDFITRKGERTVYTVDCRDGVWKEGHCTGRITAGSRYRYRALKPHGEVLFWTVGSSAPSGRFSDCKIQDGRNWICKPNADASRSVTLQMEHGAPVAAPGGGTRPCRYVSKWRWMLLNAGWTRGSPSPIEPRAASSPG
jgi:hypothetical protein